MFFSRLFLMAIFLAATREAASGDDLYHIYLSAYQRATNTNRVLATSRITAEDLIGRCVGTNDPATVSQYVLAYNASADSIQVVNTNGSSVCDVFRFLTVVTNSDASRLDRMAFLYVESQTN